MGHLYESWESGGYSSLLVIETKNKKGRGLEQVDKRDDVVGVKNYLTDQYDHVILQRFVGPF